MVVLKISGKKIYIESNLSEIVTTVETNVSLMREWLRIARETLTYKVMPLFLFFL